MADMFLVRYKRMLHIVVWVMGAEELERYNESRSFDLKDKEFRKNINAFLCSKDPFTLLSAIRGLNEPMTIKTPDRHRDIRAFSNKVNRCISVDKFSKMLSMITEGSRYSLADECALYVPLGDFESSKESAARRAVEKFGGVKNGELNAALERAKAEGGGIVMEPLNDWVVLRSCLQLYARLRYVVEYGNAEERVSALTDSGFKSVLHDGRSYYQVPMYFNTVWKDETILDRLGSATRDIVPFLEDGWLFWCQYALQGKKPGKSRRSHFLTLDPGTYAAENAVETRVLSARQALGGGGAGDDKRYYYAVNASNQVDSELAIADALSKTMISSELSASPIRFNPLAPFDITGTKSFSPTNLEGALWCLFTQNSDVHLKACTECGCAFFAVKATRTKICSPACKNKHLSKGNSVGSEF